MKSPFLRKFVMVIIPVALILSTVLVQSGTAMSVVNFEDVDTSGGPVYGTAVLSYLAGYGITVTGSNGSIDIQDVGIFENTSSPRNVFTTQNAPSLFGTWTFNFAQPVDSVSFVRVGLSGPSGPGYMGAWTATAYSGAFVVGSVGESYLGGGLWKTFDLGSGIDKIVFTSHAIGTYLPIDDLKFTPTPIPGALVLFGSGLLGLVGIGRKRLRK